jgi:hypothetical protein
VRGNKEALRVLVDRRRTKGAKPDFERRSRARVDCKNGPEKNQDKNKKYSEKLRFSRKSAPVHELNDLIDVDKQHNAHVCFETKPATLACKASAAASASLRFASASAIASVSVSAFVAD